MKNGKQVNEIEQTMHILLFTTHTQKLAQNATPWINKPENKKTCGLGMFQVDDLKIF